MANKETNLAIVGFEQWGIGELPTVISSFISIGETALKYSPKAFEKDLVPEVLPLPCKRVLEDLLDEAIEDFTIRIEALGDQKSSYLLSFLIEVKRKRTSQYEGSANLPVFHRNKRMIAVAILNALENWAQPQYAELSNILAERVELIVRSHIKGDRPPDSVVH